MLLGLVRPTAGDGHRARRAARTTRALPRPGRRAHRRARRSGPALTATENLRVLARLGAHDEARIPALLDLVGLADRAGDRFGEYSLGMKQRLGIAAALARRSRPARARRAHQRTRPGRHQRDARPDRHAWPRTTAPCSCRRTCSSELEHVCDWLLIIDAGPARLRRRAEGFAAGAEREIVLGPVDPADLLAPGRHRRAARARRRAGGRPARRRGRRPRPPAPSPRAQPAPRRRPASCSPSCTCAAPRSKSSYLRLLEGDPR